jgi:hypothetical protein
MSHLGLALILLAVVIAVILATRPSPPRRRRARSPRPPDGTSGPQTERSPSDRMRRPAVTLSPDPFHRNRWDRCDLALGVGRDSAVPDLALLLWPSPTQPACQLR